MIAASLPEAWQVAYEIARRAGGDPGCPGLYGPATPPAPARPRQLALLETDGWADATPGARKALDEALGRLTQGRHRHRDALRPRRHRGGGDHHPRRA